MYNYYQTGYYHGSSYNSVQDPYYGKSTSYYPNQHYNTNFYPNSRKYPSVDANLLYQSANETKKLMHDASLVLNKLSESKDFDAELMYAAQISDIKEVTRLIQTIGVTSKVDVKYTPDGLRLEFTSKVEPLDCCRLFIALRWR